MKRWNVKKPDIEKQNNLASLVRISPIVAQILINRGIHDTAGARSFLDSSISGLYNPFLMEGMHEAVSRIRCAINRKEKILIHGDYDVDGITATVLLYLTLKECGIEQVYYYIPNRITEGYGLGESGVLEAIRINAGLMITVDCGISSCEEIRELQSRNIDVIITDHHEVPKVLPQAYAIINPLQPACMYPDKNLSGVSVAFKLCEALSNEFQNRACWRHMDLVALGTVSDISLLIGENRILVKEGLKLLNGDSPNKGVKALLETNGLRNKEIGSYEISFILGPRINAIGRLGSAHIAAELFLTDDDDKALQIARLLNDANRERQKIENAILKEAMSKVDKEINFKEHKVIVLHKENWHTGVMGIVASRLSDRFYRPAILISTKDGIGRGSGRSIENFHLFDALVECEEVLKEYGGHEYACGLTILEKDLSNFKKVINDIASSTLSPEDMVPSLDIDMEIEIGAIDYKDVEEIAMLEPFGEGNPRPLFCSRDLKVSQPLKIIKGEHIKIWLAGGTKSFEAIGFGMAKDADIEMMLRKYSEFDLAYSVSLNNWQGHSNIQLRIEDIKPSVSSLP